MGNADSYYGKFVVVELEQKQLRLSRRGGNFSGREARKFYRLDMDMGTELIDPAIKGV